MSTDTNYILFGNFFVEVANFFKKFNSFLIDDVTGQPKKVQVIYGTPQAAWRKIWDQQNRKMSLPVLNFFAASFPRKLNREPFTGYQMFPTALDKDRKMALVSLPHMVFDLNFSVTLWTSTYKERDDLMYKILTSFIHGEICLTHFADSSKTGNYILMPIKMGDNFDDATEVEGIENKETRDIVRTDFTMVGEAYVPYPSVEVPLIDNITTKITGSYGNQELFTEIRYDMVVLFPNTPEEEITFEQIII